MINFNNIVILFICLSPILQFHHNASLSGALAKSVIIIKGVGVDVSLIEKTIKTASKEFLFKPIHGV
jgi:hypothetical protein